MQPTYHYYGTCASHLCRFQRHAVQLKCFHGTQLLINPQINISFSPEIPTFDRPVGLDHISDSSWNNRVDKP